MIYPTHIEYHGKYKINTSYKVAMRCMEISEDEKIDDVERSIAIVTLLFGDKIPVNQKTINLAIKFLQCGKTRDENKIKKKDMDFQQDEGLIEASFMGDYQIDLSESEIHWWKFCNLISGLSPKCALNRVREIRNYDISKISDKKTREKIISAQQQVALRKTISLEEQEIIDEFENQFI